MSGVGHVDREPPPPGERPRWCAPKLFLSVERDNYPRKPSSWAVDDCTRDLAAHYREARSGDRTLLMHAYAMHTRLNLEHGGPSNVAHAFAISEPCLAKVKTLANTRTAEKTARKYKPGTALMPLTAAEKSWLRSMLRELVWRSAQVAGGLSPGAPITRATRLPRAY